MTISLISCAVSLLALLVLSMNKQRELDGKSALFRIGSHSTDGKIARAWNSMVYMVTHVSVQSCKRVARRAILNAEGLFIRQFENFGQRFTTVGNAVTGYNLPRNRGSVSFFLKNIEDHKRTMRKVR